MVLACLLACACLRLPGSSNSLTVGNSAAIPPTRWFTDPPTHDPSTDTGASKQGHVAADLDERMAALHAAVPHARTLCISSRSGLNVRLLLRRVRALLTAIDGQRERGGAS